MKRIYWMISLLLILSVVLAACGGSDEPATAVAEPAAQGETAVAEEQVNTQEKPTVPPTALSGTDGCSHRRNPGRNGRCL
ncbi:MAG: hypothetical protein M5U34_00205 [Chloroflexi bacterium]|nr:hypothetical protein [Chloroflexota bacterium]